MSRQCWSKSPGLLNKRPLPGVSETPPPECLPGKSPEVPKAIQALGCHQSQLMRPASGAPHTVGGGIGKSSWNWAEGFPSDSCHCAAGRCCPGKPAALFLPSCDAYSLQCQSCRHDVPIWAKVAWAYWVKSTLLYWVWGLLHRRKLIAGTVNTVKGNDGCGGFHTFSHDCEWFSPKCFWKNIFWVRCTCS